MSPPRNEAGAVRSTEMAKGLPSGTVTFLFTDIEGSTRMVRDLGDAYSDLLDQHHRLLPRGVDTPSGRRGAHRGRRVLRRVRERCRCARSDGRRPTRTHARDLADRFAAPGADGPPRRLCEAGRRRLPGTRRPPSGRVVDAANGGQILATADVGRATRRRPGATSRTSATTASATSTSRSSCSR